MVCNRCKMVVKATLAELGFHPLSVELGEIEIKENLSNDKLKLLDDSMNQLGFQPLFTNAVTLC